MGRSIALDLRNCTDLTTNLHSTWPAHAGVTNIRERRGCMKIPESFRSRRGSVEYAGVWLVSRSEVYAGCGFAPVLTAKCNLY